MIRARAVTASFLLGVAACGKLAEGEAEAYETDGTARIETCRGFGVQVCGYKDTIVSKRIEARDPAWNGLYFERKSDGRTMCYQPLPRGLFSERLLTFRCEPSADRDSSIPIDANLLKQRLLDNLGAWAVAAAVFDVCAADERLPIELSVDWTQSRLDLGELVGQLSDHFRDDKLDLAYELQSLTVGEEPGFISAARDQTRGCEKDGLQEARRFVAEAKAVSRFYLALASTSLDQAAAQEGPSLNRQGPASPQRR